MVRAAACHLGPPVAAVHHLSGIMAARTPVYRTCSHQVATLLTRLALSLMPEKTSDRVHAYRRDTVPLAAKPA